MSLETEPVLNLANEKDSGITTLANSFFSFNSQWTIGKES